MRHQPSLPMDRGGTAGEMARQTDISVVEPNDEQASIDEFLAEGVVPGDELGTQTRMSSTGGSVALPSVS